MSNRSEDGFHIASLAHAGRLWTAYLEFDDDPHAPRSYRARIRFEPAAPDDAWEAVRTAVIIIESSYEEAMAKARAFDERQLAGLLRSALPDEADDDPGGSGAPLEADEGTTGTRPETDEGEAGPEPETDER